MTQPGKPFIIGVDGGGSKTAAVVLNQQGEVVGQGYSGPSNYHHVGLAKVREALAEAMGMAAQAAGIDLSQVAAATWAMAGAGRPAEQQQLQALADDLLPGIPVTLVNDAVAALVSGTGRRYGLVLIAGTGMIAYGENGRGDTARAGGWGYLLEGGSGYDLGRETLRAVMAAHDSGPATRLTGQILAFLDLAQPPDLVNWLYAPQRQVAEIASLAPLALAEAESGDLVAVGIASRAARALVEAAASVSQRLGFEEASVPLVLTGSLLTANPYYRELTGQFLRTRLPHLQARLPQVEAAVGAALLALTQTGVQGVDWTLPPASPAGSWASEQVNLLSHELDLRSTLEIVSLMHLEDHQAVAAIEPALPVIAEVVEAITTRMQRGGRLIYAGAGTSGRLGVLDASECPPTFNTNPEQVTGLIAGGRAALTSAIEGAEDDPEAGRVAIREIQVTGEDSVVGIAASGRTPYVMGILTEARQRGALTVALVCNLPSPLADYADHVIAPLVGPEMITGSTRLKAGTAQKLVLNMLSTATMVRLGKTYGNLMVDVRPSNDKLRARAGRIVAQVCDLTEVEAQAALSASGGEVKVAIVSHLAACSPETARRYLAEARGVIRSALRLAARDKTQ